MIALVLVTVATLLVVAGLVTLGAHVDQRAAARRQAPSLTPRMVSTSPRR